MKDPRPREALDIVDLALIEVDDEATELEKRLARDLRFVLLHYGRVYRQSFLTTGPK